MKIVQINDCDWFIGENLESCVAEYIAHYGDSTEDTKDAYVLDNDELERLKFTEDGEEVRSFKEQLQIEIEKGGEFPRYFAGTEW